VNIALARTCTQSHGGTSAEISTWNDTPTYNFAFPSFCRDIDLQRNKHAQGTLARQFRIDRHTCYTHKHATQNETQFNQFWIGLTSVLLHTFAMNIYTEEHVAWISSMRWIEF